NIAAGRSGKPGGLSFYCAEGMDFKKIDLFLCRFDSFPSLTRFVPMPKDNEYGTKSRLLRVMRDLIERPYGYTKKQLALAYNVHVDTIANDFEVYGELGLEMDCDEKFRYAFKVNKPLKRVRELLYFS